MGENGQRLFGVAGGNKGRRLVQLELRTIRLEFETSANPQQIIFEFMALKSEDGKGVVEAGFMRAKFEGSLVSLFPVKIRPPLIVALADKLLHGRSAQA
jgi:hypothetical protein